MCKREGILLSEGGFLPLTSSLVRRDWMWVTLGSARGSWSTHSSRLLARARARGRWRPRLLDSGTLEKKGEYSDSVFYMRSYFRHLECDTMIYKWQWFP